MQELQYFWQGDSQSARKLRIVDKIRRAWVKIPGKNGAPSSMRLSFRIGDSNTAHEVCEPMYLRVVGHRKSTMWNAVKKRLLELFEMDKNFTEDDLRQLDEQIKSNKASSESGRRKLKFDHATSYIEQYALDHACLSPYAGEEGLRIMPFENVSQLYAEYKAYSKYESEQAAKIAKKEWFRRAWQVLYKAKKVKFTRGKGTFPTCDICNHCNDMLSHARAASKLFSRRQRDIIAKYKTQHQEQQAAERKALDLRKIQAKTSYGNDGQPTHCVIFGDGMTKYAGITPKYGRRVSKGDYASFENRVFGVEVYCGPIAGEILVHTDELVRGGANFVCEVCSPAPTTIFNRYSSTAPFIYAVVLPSLQRSIVSFWSNWVSFCALRGIPCPPTFIFSLITAEKTKTECFSHSAQF